MRKAVAAVAIAVSLVADSCNGGGNNGKPPPFKEHGYVYTKPQPRGALGREYVLGIKLDDGSGRVKEVLVDEYQYNHCDIGNPFPECAR